eukprot:2088555-Pleurochrysis_carterae.AAC.1
MEYRPVYTLTKERGVIQENASGEKEKHDHGNMKTTRVVTTVCTPLVSGNDHIQPDEQTAFVRSARKHGGSVPIMAIQHLLPIVIAECSQAKDTSGQTNVLRLKSSAAFLCGNESITLMPMRRKSFKVAASHDSSASHGGSRLLLEALDALQPRTHRAHVLIALVQVSCLLR